MANQVLKDSAGRKIGEIRTSGSNQTIHDAAGRKKGEFRPSSNSTHDSAGRRLEQGTC